MDKYREIAALVLDRPVETIGVKLRSLVKVHITNMLYGRHLDPYDHPHCCTCDDSGLLEDIDLFLPELGPERPPVPILTIDDWFSQ